MPRRPRAFSPTCRRRPANRCSMPVFRWIRSSRRKRGSTPSWRLLSWGSSRATWQAPVTPVLPVPTPTRSRGAAPTRRLPTAKQPARGLRAAVRRQREHGSEGAARAPPSTAQHSGFHDRGSLRASGPALCRPTEQARRVSRGDPRRGTAYSRRPRHRAISSCRPSTTRRAFQPPTRSMSS